MNKAGAAAVIFFLLAAGAIGYIAYETMQPTPIDPGTALYIYEKIFPPPPQRNTWYTKYDSYKYTNPALTNILFSELRIEFEIRPGEHVLFSFSTQIFLPSGGPFTAAAFFVVDGIDKEAGYPSCGVAMDTSDGASIQSCSMLMALSLSPGTHNVTVKIIGTDTGIRFSDTSMAVQTYTT